MVAKSIICLLHLELFYHVFCRACTALNERVQDSNKQLIQGGGTILLLHSELAHQTFSPMQLGMQECIIHASVEMQQKQERRFCQAILLQLKQNPNQNDKVIPRRRNTCCAACMIVYNGKILAYFYVSYKILLE